MALMALAALAALAASGAGQAQSLGGTAPDTVIAPKASAVARLQH